MEEIIMVIRIVGQAPMEGIIRGLGQTRKGENFIRIGLEEMTQGVDNIIGDITDKVPGIQGISHGT